MTTGSGDVGELRRTAAARGGVFTVADALATGFTPGQVRQRVAVGAWVRLRRGVLVEAELLERVSVQSRRRHRLEIAGALAATAGTWASHSSAAAVHGLDLLHAPGPETVQLTRPAVSGTRVRRFGPVELHECGLPAAQRTSRGGVRTTNAARAAVDVARQRGLLDGVVAMDSALRRRRASMATLEAAVALCGGWPGSTAAVQAVGLADPLAESVLESVSRVELVRRDLHPETQCWLAAGGSALRVDFLWWRERTVGEADGLGKYAKYGPSDRLDPLQKEKLRQELLEDWGFEVVRWGWAEIRRDPNAVATRVRRAFARAEVRRDIRARNGEIDVVRRLTAAPWDLPTDW